jgi:hypothetical protein
MKSFIRLVLCCVLAVSFFGLVGFTAAVGCLDLQEINVFTYNHDDDIPLAVDILGAEDAVFVDWDDDGDLDIITSGNYLLGLVENIGTPQGPRFTNLFKNGKILLNDSRVGRYITCTRNPGVESYPNNALSIIGFDRQTNTYDVGNVDLKLRMYTPDRNGGDVAWTIVPAYNSDGEEIEMFADTWLCPTIDAADLNGDGKDDLVVGSSHPKRTIFPDSMEGSYEYTYYASRLYIMCNISDGEHLTFSDPVMLEADGRPISAFGYIYQRLIDLDSNGLVDLVVGQSIPGMKWYRNIGSREQPQFTYAGDISDEKGETIKTNYGFSRCFAISKTWLY